jgi:CDP-6-deoxy-D-xylo-4-hexulose-3-dehydrase
MNWKLQENVIGESETNLLISFLRKAPRLTQSDNVHRFEAAFSEWQGCRYSVFVNSGSSANLLLVSALKELRGWSEGDEIIVPAVTWPTTVTPIIQSGLKPVFVDVNLEDLSFDYDRIEAKISPRTRAIFVVHLLGFPADVERIKQIAKEHDIVVIEDCCESHGAAQDGVKVGSLSLAGTFSFYWGHHITSIEGGIVTTDDEDLYKLLLLKRSHGLARELPSECHSEIKRQYPDIDFNFLFLTDGFNFRNTEFNAILGLSQLKKLDEYIIIRNHNYEKFLGICNRFPGDLLTLDVSGKSSFSLPFFFRDIEKKKGFQDHMYSLGIENRPIIGGNLLRQPFLSDYYEEAEFKNSDFLHTNGFYIGNNQFVNDERIRYLAKIMKEFFHAS